MPGRTYVEEINSVAMLGAKRFECCDGKRERKEGLAPNRATTVDLDFIGKNFIVGYKRYSKNSQPSYFIIFVELDDSNKIKITEKNQKFDQKMNLDCLLNSQTLACFLCLCEAILESSSCMDDSVQFV